MRGVRVRRYTPCTSSARQQSRCGALWTVTKKAGGDRHKPGSVPLFDLRWWPFIWDADCSTPHATYPGASSGPLSGAPLFGLAPGGVYQACNVTVAAGELLPHLFTLTGQRPGGIFSVALSLGLPPVRVTDHPALWSPDFPPGKNIARRSPAVSAGKKYTLT